MGKGLSSQNPESVSICLCGQAGQGIQTVEHLLTRIFKLAGFNVFATKEYMSRIRGGMNSTSIRIGPGAVRAAVSTIDILVPLNSGALRHVEHNISARTIVLADKEMMARIAITYKIRLILISIFHPCISYLNYRKNRKIINPKQQNKKTALKAVFFLRNDELQKNQCAPFRVKTTIIVFKRILMSPHNDQFSIYSISFLTFSLTDSRDVSYPPVTCAKPVIPGLISRRLV